LLRQLYGSPAAGEEGAVIEQYGAIVLSNVPRRELSSVFLTRLDRAVREDGLGLLVVGGKNALGPGGYADNDDTPSTLERLLPVTVRPSRHLAVVVALDISGSMLEGTEAGKRIDVAKKELIKMESKIDELLQGCDSGENPIEILQLVQKEFGHISREHMTLVSKRLNIPLVKLYGVATFYTQFKLKPEGKYTINICRGTACHVKNSFVFNVFIVRIRPIAFYV